MRVLTSLARQKSLKESLSCSETTVRRSVETTLLLKNRGDLVIGSDETEIDRELKKLKADVSLEELEGPRLIGTPSQIISKIEEYLKLGVDYFVVLA